MSSEATDVLLELRHEFQTKADFARARWEESDDMRVRVGAQSAENAFRQAVTVIDIHLRNLVGSGT